MVATEGRARRRAGALALALAAIAVGVVVAKRRRMKPHAERERRTGVSDNGMEFEVLGDGLRTLLFIPGGPGSEIPTGLMAKMMSSQFTPYVRAGFTVWHVTRRRNMPQGYSIADMADDYAAFVAAEMGGTVDLVVGESYGGLVAQYLASNHPTLVHRVVLAVSAGAITDTGKDLDRRWAAARAEGRFADAGEVFLEYVLPGADRAALRRRLGPLAGRLFVNSPVPAEDLLVEAEAEGAFDARGILSGIQAPVLIVCGDQDEFFSREIVEETAQLIPDSTLVWNAGMGHVRAAMNPGTPRAVLKWAGAAKSASRHSRGPSAARDNDASEPTGGAGGQVRATIGEVSEGTYAPTKLDP